MSMFPVTSLQICSRCNEPFLYGSNTIDVPLFPICQPCMSPLTREFKYKETEPVFKKGDIKEFKWSDLHDKNLKIIYSKNVDGECVMGYDEKEDKYYLLHMKVIPEKS